jgi:hypothetical protein
VTGFITLSLSQMEEDAKKCLQGFFHLLLLSLFLVKPTSALAQSHFNFSSLPAAYKTALANALQTTLEATQGLLALKSASLINAQGNDCTQFSGDGICAQLGARYTELASPKISSKSIIFNTAYKYSKNWHFGTYIDAGTIASQPSFSDVQQRGHNPIYGIYSVFSEQLEGQPFFLRLGANMGSTEIELSSPNIANLGSLSRTYNIQGQSYLAVVGTPLPLNEKLIFLPYLGTTYTSLKIDGANNNSSRLSNLPIVFNDVSADIFALQLGFNTLYRKSESLSFSASAGIQHTMTSYMTNLNVPQSSLFSSYAGQTNLANNVPVFTANVKYIPLPNQELGAKISYRQEVYQRIGVSSYMLTYSIGF